jgi:phage shock protein A
VGGSIFMRMSGAVLSHIEVGIGSAEHASRWRLSRSSIREMEAAIEDARSQRFAAENNRDQAARERATQLLSAATLGDDAVYALGKERQDLAERAIVRQLDAEHEAQEAAGREEKFSTEAVRLGALIDELTIERQRMAAELAEIERNRPDINAKNVGGETPEQRFERAHARFDRLMEDERNGSSAASIKPHQREIDDLRQSDRVAERLAVLRAGAKPRTKRPANRS